MIWGAIIVAAGRGTRFGRPKQFAEVAGLPLVGWSLRTFAAMPEIAHIAVATEPEWIEPMRKLAAALVAKQTVAVVRGGTTRRESVRSALDALDRECNAVFVHDGARPLVHAGDVRAGMAKVRRGYASILAAPVIDTIKQVDATRGIVRETLDRAGLWAAQTPQFAMRSDLERSHEQGQSDATDDAVLLERIGIEVSIVPATGENFKVTNPGDVERAEALLRERLEHVPSEEEILLVEVFADDALVAAIETELESRGARIDAVERDLPTGIAVRAFVPAERLRGFAQRFEAFAAGTATFTTRFSHYAGRDEGSTGP
ncbi:MAG: 2-C-methyl-D-erythritol 4-phosphate cytidylyltransferase [Candidatus Eremiobacteraeota bacterium]|nr:2-C-methyl-D-erythritol 4-phosphate cytidylyltransferase [Candidatus Eremiobacteraeota bacterium]